VLEPMTSSELSLGAEVAAPPIVSHEQIVVCVLISRVDALAIEAKQNPSFHNAAHILELRAMWFEMPGYELLSCFCFD